MTVDSLKNDLMIAEACGSLGIVVHFGHLKSQDVLEGYQNIIRCMNDVLASWAGRAKLLIENQAGDHGAMGMTLEECVKVDSLPIIRKNRLLSGYLPLVCRRWLGHSEYG